MASDFTLSQTKLSLVNTDMNRLFSSKLEQIASYKIRY